MSNVVGFNRRSFLKGAGMTALAGAAAPVLADDDDGQGLFLNGKYDFETVYSRDETNCYRWDFPRSKYPESKINYGMGVATMDFATPPCVREAVTKRVQHHVWGYMHSKDSLVEAIVNWNRDRYDLDIDPNNMVISAGVHPGLLAAMRAFSPAGTRIALLTPAYSSFYSDFTITDTLANEIELKHNGERYEIDWDELERSLTPDTHSMIVCNPHNPTGNVWTEEELLRIGQICLDKNIVVFSDEIHADFVNAGHEYVPFARLPNKKIVDNSISFNSTSKSFNLAGMRNAYFYSTNADLMDRAKRPHFGTVAEIGCTAAEAAYREGGEWLDQLLVYIDDNHRFVEKYATENMPTVGFKRAEGTFLSWLDFSDTMNRIDAKGRAAASDVTPEDYMQKWLVDHSGVYLNPGSMYGLGSDGHMRLNIGSSRKVVKGALENLSTAVNKA